MNLFDLTERAKTEELTPAEALASWANSARDLLAQGEGARYQSFFTDLAAQLRERVPEEETKDYDAVIAKIEADLDQLHESIRERNLSIAARALSNEVEERRENEKSIGVGGVDKSGGRASGAEAVVYSGVSAPQVYADGNSVRALAEDIVGLTLLEANELRIILKDEYGIEPAAGGAVMMAGPAGGAGGADEEEKTEFDVILKSAGDKKINVIKEVRAMTGLGLKEAKELVEAVGKPIKEGISKEEAEEIKRKLEEAGAKIELK